MSVNVEIINPGFLSTVQDLGRRSGLAEGLPRGGAMDSFLVSLSNIFLGNDESAPVIEFCQVGPTVRFSVDTDILVAGHVDLTINGNAATPWCVHCVKAGQELDVGHLKSGLWGYLAIAGGVRVSLLAGSASTHPHLNVGGLEGRSLMSGDILPCSSAKAPQLGVGISRGNQTNSESRVIHCVKGAQWGWFSESAQSQFLSQEYRISQVSDRVGYRLDGEPLSKNKRELVSEGAITGTVQITNEGVPIVLMADAQTMGGYPKIAHVIQAHQGRLAQSRAGKRIQFKMVSHSEAMELLTQQKAEKERLQNVLHL